MVRCNSKPAVSVLPLTTLSNKSRLLTDEAWATTKHAIGVQRVATSKTGFDSTVDKRAPVSYTHLTLPTTPYV